ncbi:hypothetical protein [Streptomyces broussonetiae]|uniref:Uncharacterized protein n=1 Tax=Streptomyces broussonetiae TaxID=2686304 RepID=A0ABV5ELJ0_9ACTN
MSSPTSPIPPVPPVPGTRPGPAAPLRGPRPALAAALVVGLVVGGGAVGAAWALDGDDGTPGAADDVRAACRALDGFEEADYTKDGPAGEIATNRFAAAIVLSASAAAAETEYKPLADALREAQNQHARTFDLADAKVRKPLTTARDICAGL